MQLFGCRGDHLGTALRLHVCCQVYKQVNIKECGTVLVVLIAGYCIALLALCMQLANGIRRTNVFISQQLSLPNEFAASVQTNLWPLRHTIVLTGFNICLMVVVLSLTATHSFTPPLHILYLPYYTGAWLHSGGYRSLSARLRQALGLGNGRVPNLVLSSSVCSVFSLRSCVFWLSSSVFWLCIATPSSRGFHNGPTHIGSKKWPPRPDRWIHRAAVQL